MCIAGNGLYRYFGDCKGWWLCTGAHYRVGDSYLPSQYVVIPCGHEMISYTPKGMNGAKFRARYGVVGLSIVLKDFVVEGLNEAGLSAGLFYFPITEIILFMTQSRIHGQWPIYSW